jgi:hypothetical protein
MAVGVVDGMMDGREGLRVEGVRVGMEVDVDKVY